MVFNTIIYKYWPSDMRRTTKVPLTEQPIYKLLPTHAQQFLKKSLAFAERTKADTYISIDHSLAVCMKFDVATFSGSMNWDLAQLIYLADDLIVMPMQKKLFEVEFTFLYDRI